jgi:hypothetical protein
LQALFFAPVFGLDRLPAFDPHAHPLGPLLGRGSHGSPLSQVLGHLDRLEAAAALRPALVPARPGPISSGAGPRLAFWPRLARPKGQRTRRGRIMAGAQAVSAHNAAGQALWGVSYPPARHGSQGMGAYGQHVAPAPGIALFGMERAGNAVALARACAAQGWGWLCLLAANAPQGVESVAAPQGATRADGTPG